MLNSPIGKLAKIGPAYENRLKKLNIFLVEDLLYHFPVRYEDRRIINKLSDVIPGQRASVVGIVWQIKTTRTKYGKFLTFATINDGTSSLECVWFNQAYISNVVKSGRKLGLSGKVDYFSGKLTLISPEYEFIYSNTRALHTQGLVPIYPETRGVSSKWLRSKIYPLLQERDLKNFEQLPDQILKRHELVSWIEAIRGIHFPKDLTQISQAKRRLAFEEFFLLQLAGQRRKLSWQKKRISTPFSIDQAKILSFISGLPFSLTKSQNKVVKEITKDLSQNKPMNRLLQGDVGSGKTVVAAIAAYITVTNNKGVIFMAPTEILADQHFKTLSSMLDPYGIKIGLQTSSKKTSSKVDLLVGTHALITSKHLPENIGLTIIDEQQRFGVQQRSLLKNKSLVSHYLTMSATPIPRTMALTLYGDLEFSVINELPKGRQKIKTFVVPREKRDKAYNFIRDHVHKKSQAFIICPLIDPSETLVTVKNANEEWQRLSREVFPELSVDLLHGRLKSKEKESVVEKFKKGDSDILVSTPVVEVGIDVPNATIMVIEAAERFGLSQLHQLRGRVGRGEDQSFCFLFTESENPEILRKLKNMEVKHIGLELAELDLKIRGPGQLYGTAQHGIPELKIANLANIELIEETKKEVEKILDLDPQLQKSPLLKAKISKDKVSPD